MQSNNMSFEGRVTSTEEMFRVVSTEPKKGSTNGRVSHWSTPVAFRRLKPGCDRPGNVVCGQDLSREVLCAKTIAREFKGGGSKINPHGLTAWGILGGQRVKVFLDLELEVFVCESYRYELKQARAAQRVRENPWQMIKARIRGAERLLRDYRSR